MWVEVGTYDKLGFLLAGKKVERTMVLLSLALCVNLYLSICLVWTLNAWTYSCEINNDETNE